MLKKILIIFCFVGYVNKANAQFIHSVEYKAGASVSAIDWHLYNDFGLNNHLYLENFYGFTSAFNINYLNHSFWNVSSQLSFIQIGGKDNFEYTDPIGLPLPSDNRIIQNKMNYLSLNTLLKLKYPIKNFTPNLKIGPHIDYMLSANYYTEDFSRLNYGLNLAAGLDFKINDNFYFTSEINYIWYMNIIKAGNLELSFTKYASVMIGIGYTFNQNK